MSVGAVVRRAGRGLGDGLVDLARRRGWRGRLILGLLAVQLLAPLHYYLVREDRRDERFAWRMFSPTRMLRCDPVFRVDGAPAALTRTFHEAWITLAQRGRTVVLEAMGAQLCARHPGARVELQLTCTSVDGVTTPHAYDDLCEDPEL